MDFEFQSFSLRVRFDLSHGSSPLNDSESVRFNSSKSSSLQNDSSSENIVSSSVAESFHVSVQFPENSSLGV